LVAEVQFQPSLDAFDRIIKRFLSLIIIIIIHRDVLTFSHKSTTPQLKEVLVNQQNSSSFLATSANKS
jgi:hypothetical protein